MFRLKRKSVEFSTFSEMIKSDESITGDLNKLSKFPINLI